MKRKLLLLFCVLLTSVGTWADPAYYTLSFDLTNRASSDWSSITKVPGQRTYEVAVNKTGSFLLVYGWSTGTTGLSADWNNCDLAVRHLAPGATVSFTLSDASQATSFTLHEQDGATRTVSDNVVTVEITGSDVNMIEMRAATTSVVITKLEITLPVPATYTYDLTGLDKSAWNTISPSVVGNTRTYDVTVNGSGGNLLVWGWNTSESGVTASGNWLAVRNLSQGDKVDLTFASESSPSDVNFYPSGDESQITRSISGKVLTTNIVANRRMFELTPTASTTIEKLAITRNRIDMTNFITNPRFIDSDVTNNGLASLTGWNLTRSGGNGNLKSTVAEFWNCTFDLKQTITNLPNGKYIISVNATSKDDKGVLYASSNSTEYTTSLTKTSDNTTFDAIVTEFNKSHGDANRKSVVAYVTNNTLTIGVRQADSHDGSTWIVLGDFSLTYDPIADSDDYADLNDAITAAEDYTLGFDNGEYAPYNNVDALTALATAKAINQTTYNLRTDVQAATTALTDATWTANSGEVNAIYNPTFSLSTNNMTALGWSSDDGSVIGNESGSYHSRAMVGVDNLGTLNSTKSALYLRFDGTESQVTTIYNYGTVTGYSMPLKANTIYRVKADAAVWSTDGTQCNKDLRVAILNSSSTEVAGQTLTTPNRSMGGGNTDYISYDFLFCPSADGNYTLTVDNMATTSTSIVITNFELKKAASQTLTLPSAIPYAAGTYPSVTIDRTFSSSKWNTLCAPFAFAKSAFADVKVLNSITVNGENVSMTFADASETVAAGTPCLVKPSENNYTLTVNNVALNPSQTVQESSAAADGYTVNFVGTFAGTSLTSSNTDAWVVSNSMLYNVNSDVTVGAYRAYFTVGTSAPVKGLFFDFGGADAIKNVETDNMKDATIFNLAGQRVNKAQKGIYIVNGKKVLVK